MKCQLTMVSCTMASRLLATPFAVVVLATTCGAQTLSFDDGTFIDGPDDTAATSPAEDILSMGFRFADNPYPADPADTALTNAVVDTAADGTFPGENRARARDFGGESMLTYDGPSSFDLISFSLSNFTFNAGHTHGMTVTYNYDDSTSESTTYNVGTEIPGDRSQEANFVVNKTGLASVVFTNTQRLVYVDDIVLRVPEPATGAALIGSLLCLLPLRRQR